MRGKIQIVAVYICIIYVYFATASSVCLLTTTNKQKYKKSFFFLCVTYIYLKYEIIKMSQGTLNLLYDSIMACVLWLAYFGLNILI